LSNQVKVYIRAASKNVLQEKMLDNLVYFIGACLVLVVSAEVLVKSLTKIANYFRMSDFIVGFMIVALATSIPELFIGITAALDGAPELSLGNVVGSAIVDLTLVVGVLALLRRGIKIETKAVRTDTLYMFMIAVLPLVLLLFDNSLDRFDGFILLSAFLIYMLKVYVQRSRFHDEEVREEGSKNIFMYSILGLVSLVVLVFSANELVIHAEAMAIELDFPEILIGIVIVSVGTTLPELIFGSRAVLMKHKYMAFGDIIGSVIANNTLVLGVVLLVSPSSLILDNISLLLFLTSSFFMVVVAFLFTTFVEVEKHILWQEGVALILLYILFMIVILNINILKVYSVA